MLAMHYRFHLADGHDMGAVRARITERGPAFDDMPGLHRKAFLVGDRALGDPANVYATFYLWESEQAALDFLRSDAFRAVSEAFGRPAVSLWPVLSTAEADDAVTADAAHLERTPVDGLELPGAARADSSAPWSLVALDPHDWVVVRFTLVRAAMQARGDFRLAYLAGPGTKAGPAE